MGELVANGNSKPADKATTAAIEREVERRVTAALASAGLPETAIAASAVWMLPDELLTAYGQLFSRALKLDRAGSGVIRESGLRAPERIEKGPRAGQVKKSSEAFGRGESRGSWRNAGGVDGIQGVMAGVTGGGKRYRENWIVQDQVALDLKSSIDRKLKRVAQDIARGLGDTPAHSITCGRCGNDLSKHKDLGDIHFCPYCGSRPQQWEHVAKRRRSGQGGS